MYRKKNLIYIEFGTICGFRHPLGGRETYPLQKRTGGSSGWIKKEKKALREAKIKRGVFQ